MDIILGCERRCCREFFDELRGKVSVAQRSYQYESMETHVRISVSLVSGRLRLAQQKLGCVPASPVQCFTVPGNFDRMDKIAIERPHLFQRLIIDKASRIFGDLELSLLNVLPELPIQTETSDMQPR